MIYFDQSATSAHKPPRVIPAMRAALEMEYGNPGRGAHPYANSALKALALARRTVARYFGVPPMNLAFTPNATTALNLAIHGALTPGDRVLTTAWSHNAMLRPLYQLQDRGMRLDILQSADFSIKDLERAIHPDTTALALNAMSNVSGEAQPLCDIARLCEGKGLLLILDLAQWAGAQKLPGLTSWPRTLMAFTGHKSLYGPMGTGGLINLGQVPLTPWLTGGSGVHSFARTQPEVFPEVCEPGTPNLPGILGLAAGIEFIEETGQENITGHLLDLRRALTDGLKDIPGIVVYGSAGAAAENPTPGPVVSLNVGDLDSTFVSQALAEDYGLATRSGIHCAPLWHQATSTENRGAVRFSFSFFNTHEEVETALSALRALAKRA